MAIEARRCRRSVEIRLRDALTQFGFELLDRQRQDVAKDRCTNIGHRDGAVGLSWKPKRAIVAIDFDVHPRVHAKIAPLSVLWWKPQLTTGTVTGFCYQVLGHVVKAAEHTVNRWIVSFLRQHQVRLDAPGGSS
jgi:hypothetical protein